MSIFAISVIAWRSLIFIEARPGNPDFSWQPGTKLRPVQHKPSESGHGQTARHEEKLCTVHLVAVLLGTKQKILLSLALRSGESICRTVTWRSLSSF